MICVSIGRTRHKMVVAEHKHLAEKGAELIELRLDWLSRRPDLARLTNNRPTPVVVTCRSRDDKGRWRGTEDQRLAILREAIVSGVEYVDLEGTIAGKIPRYGDTKRIVSYHNFEETPDHLPDILEDLEGKDPDIVKIVTTANTPADNVRMLELVATAKVPVVGFCMGELGIPSRILCGKYGSPFTYASFSKERELAPGQLSYAETRAIYGFDRIDKDTKVFGLLGDPVAHSHSPFIHNAAFRKLKLNAVYIPFRVPPELLSETIDEFDRLRFRGYSVTIPHKEEALTKGIADEIASDVGASNTLFRRNKKWHATNTDYSAAVEALQDVLDARPPDKDKQIEDRRVLILGAGGVAKAIALAMVRKGASVVIANRGKKRGKGLAEKLGCQAINWENRGSEHADIVINCTSVGMHPKVDETPYEEHWLRENAIAFDTVYTPENTLFLKNAKLRGCETVSGLDMFVRQAAHQFRIFTGQEPPTEYMRDTLRKWLSPGR
ncbi:MAG: shikimate dehydrogenase [Planctomycetaceae bacterium]